MREATQKLFLNKNLVLVIAFCIAFSFAMPVLAQDSNTDVRNDRRVLSPQDLPRRVQADVRAGNLATTTVRDRVNDIETDVEERKEVRREVRRENLTDHIKDRVGAFVEVMLKRFRAATERLERLAERIESRIVKLEERGLDLSEAKRLLEVAKGEIAEAVRAVGAVPEAVREALAGDNPREGFAKVKEILAEAKQSLKDAHAALVQSIRAIKASVDSGESEENNDEE